MRRRILAALARALDRDRFHLFLRLAPVTWTRLQFRRAMGWWPDLDSPRLFSDKMTWLMLHSRDPLWTRCGDKLGMRQWAVEHRLADLLPKLYGVWDSSDEIDFGALPDRFVLKCSHGCGFNLFCRERGSFDVADAKRRVAAWLGVDYSLVNGEPHYGGMPRRVFAEEFFEDRGLPFPVDYKAYTFHGRVHCFAVGSERNSDGEALWDSYDAKWEQKLPYFKGSLQSTRSIPRPASLDEMVAAAEILGAPFPFVRIDFYDIDGRARLGEMTFTSSAARDPHLTAEAQRELGALLNLPDRRVKVSPRGSKCEGLTPMDYAP